MTRILVVGTGSAGKRHLGNIQSLGVKDLGAVDTRPDRRAEVTERFGVKQTYARLEEALQQRWDGVVVCTPPSSHVPVAAAAVKHGAHVLVEKPLSNSLEGTPELERLVRENGVTLTTGYTYRFWPALNKFRDLVLEGAIGRVYSVRIIFSEYLPDWHTWEDYRSFYMASQELGGGALLDESHTVDFARWIFGEVAEVAAVNGRVSNLEISSDDLGELVLRFRSGAVGSIHLDIFGRSYQKSMEAIGERGNLRWDYYQNKVELYHAEGRRWETFLFNDERNFMFLQEDQHFLRCIEGKATPRVDLQDGLRTLRCVLAARESSRTGRFVPCGEG